MAIESASAPDLLTRYADPLEHLGLRREGLPVVKAQDRLVPIDFRYGHTELVQEVLQAMKDRANFAGYPAQGLHWTEKEYFQWFKSGRPVDELVGFPGMRPAYYVGLHENRNIVEDGRLSNKLKNLAIEAYRGDGAKIARTERFARLILASDGSPIHPMFKEAVTSPEGIVTGPGFYWFLGPNEAADPVIIRIHDNKFEVVLIERSDRGGRALPGGMIDKTRTGWSKGGAVAVIEQAITAAKRELKEETGIGIEDLNDIMGISILDKVTVGDFRMTAQAWPVTSVFLFIPKPQTAEVMVPAAADDARLASWIGVGGNLIWKGITQDVMFASHASYIKLAILKLEQLFGVVVKTDGTVGKAQ